MSPGEDRRAQVSPGGVRRAKRDSRMPKSAQEGRGDPKRATFSGADGQIQ